MIGMAVTSGSPNHGVANRALLVCLIIALTAIHVQFILKVQRSENTRSAFLRWRAQLEQLDEGVNVWEKYAYPNPPIMAMVLKPFCDLPPAQGAAVWFFLKSLLALVSIVIVWRLFDALEVPFPPWGKAVAAVLTLRPIEGDLVHGNVNLVILFLVVGVLALYCLRRDGAAGVVLGLAIACKLTPALFVLYFLYKRAWNVLAGTGIGLVVFGLIVPGMWFGWTNNLTYLRSWHEQMIAPYAAGEVTSEHKNQSLPGLLHRLLRDEASVSDYVEDRKVVIQTHHFVSWDRDVVQGIVAFCMAVLGVLGMAFCRASTAQRHPVLMMAEFGVVVLGMLLFCERTWKHHCVTLLLPFSVLAYAASVPSFRRGWRWFFGGVLAGAAGLMLATSTGLGETQDRVALLAQVYGAYVGAFFLLLGGLFVLLNKMTSAETNCAPTPSAAHEGR